MSLFGRHRREFARAVRDRAWERAPEGIWFPRQGALLHGAFTLRTREGSIRQANTLGTIAPTMAAAMFTGDTALQSMYFAPYTSPVPVQVAWANGDIYLAGELGDGPEGYSEGSRQQWVPADAGGGVMSNSGALATATIVTATSIDVWGIALVPAAADKRFGALPFNPGLSIVEFPTTQLHSYGTSYDDGAGNTWIDFGGDDVWDGVSWTDPFGDDVGSSSDVGLMVNLASLGMFAATTFLAPATYANGDPLDMQYDLMLEP